MKKRIITFLLILSCFVFSSLCFAETKLSEEPGTYPVITSYLEDGKELKKTVYVTIKGPNTVIDGNVAIDAKDFRLTIDQVKEISERKAIYYSDAKAWSTIDGTEKDITSVDLSNLRLSEGVFELTFSTREGVSKTVNVIIDAPLLGNSDFNSYGNVFDKSYWRFQLTVGSLLALLLATPLLIIVFSSRNIVHVIDQLIDIFSK